jgi:hypothetical protein
VNTGAVLLGYGHSKTVPVPELTRDHFVTVLPVPVSCLRLVWVDSEGGLDSDGIKTLGRGGWGSTSRSAL